MGKDIIKELNMASREEVVVFLKSLWVEKPLPCPQCGGKLDYLPQKAKKKATAIVSVLIVERFIKQSISYTIYLMNKFRFSSRSISCLLIDAQ